MADGLKEVWSIVKDLTEGPRGIDEVPHGQEHHEDPTISVNDR